MSFRWYAQRQAQALGLAGWVRNRPDGTVEAVAEGPPDGVDTFIAWARHGPSMAEVEHVDVIWEDPTGERPPFRIAG